MTRRHLIDLLCAGELVYGDAVRFARRHPDGDAAPLPAALCRLAPAQRAATVATLHLPR